MNAQKLVHFIMAVLICFIVGLAIWFMYYTNSQINENDLCGPIDFHINKHARLDYIRSARVRICISALIELALITSTWFTLRLLNGLSREYAKEIFRVKLIYVTFIVSYSSWIVFDIINLLFVYTPDFKMTAFADEMQTIWLPFIWDLMPILVVLILHSRILYWTYKQRKL